MLYALSACAPVAQACARLWQARIQFCSGVPFGVDVRPPLIRANCGSAFNTQSLRPETLSVDDAALTARLSAPPVFECDPTLGAGPALASFAGADPVDAVDEAATRTTMQFCPVQWMRSGPSTSNSISFSVVLG